MGNRTKAKVVKNKVAPPFKEAEFDILYGKGISASGDILDLAVVNNIVEKSGAWFSYGTERIGQGREKAKEYLEQNPETMKTIETQLREKLKVHNRGAAPAAAAEAS
jgi:recombination protein RecA